MCSLLLGASCVLFFGSTFDLMAEPAALDCSTLGSFFGLGLFGYGFFLADWTLPVIYLILAIFISAFLEKSGSNALRASNSHAI